MNFMYVKGTRKQLEQTVEHYVNLDNVIFIGIARNIDTNEKSLIYFRFAETSFDMDYTDELWEYITNRISQNTNRVVIKELPKPLDVKVVNK